MNSRKNLLAVEQIVAHARELERLGQHASARDEFEAALQALAYDASAPYSAAALLRWVGTMHRSEGNVAAATDCFSASLASAEAFESLVDRAHALNWLGVVAQEQGHAAAAEELYNDARALAEKAGDARLLVMIVQNLGVLATIEGDRERALQHYRSSLDRVRHLGDEDASAILLNNVGTMHMQLGQYHDAARAFEECTRACENTGNLQVRAVLEVNGVELDFLSGDLDGALRRCHRARVLASQVDHGIALGMTYRWFGTISRARGDYPSAEAHLEAAVDIAERFENSLLNAESQKEMALLFREQDRNHEALQSLSRAHAIFRELRAMPLLRDVEGALHELEAIYLDVVQRWSESIERKDHYTRGHCQRVADYACELARAAGLDDITLTWFRMGALLHDVVKIAIPAEVLNKPGILSKAERAIIERHPVIGDEMLASMTFPWDIRPMVRGHHERWDGNGYPDRLARNDIPEPARILCIADVFDALTTDRPYRAGFSAEHAMRIMREDAGRMFDPDLFAIFDGGLADLRGDLAYAG